MLFNIFELKSLFISCEFNNPGVSGVIASVYFSFWQWKENHHPIDIALSTFCTDETQDWNSRVKVFLKDTSNIYNCTIL